MSLLKKPNPSLTKDQKLQLVVAHIANLSRTTFETLIKTQNQGIDMLWHNREFTPQEIINALDENAVKIFQFHGGLTNLVESIAQTDKLEVNIKLPTNNFSVEKNGKITILDEPYVKTP